MANNQPGVLHRDTATVGMACLFIIVAVVFLWDTTRMLDSDSYVFPRAVAIAMIVLSLALIVWNLVKPRLELDETIIHASTIRRVALVAAMLAGCLAMPWLGFLIPGIITFFLLMFIAMYDEWSMKRKILYPLVAVAIVVSFYTLFGNLLQVPLPVGS
ncbi:MAG: tripartite tricarboxylate transporter TctB family protein, partial [Desulfofustis sp.]|nr:tripartite tricarboxylate transporter TctB family protein [Desulfofustis sp.]